MNEQTPLLRHNRPPPETPVDAGSQALAEALRSSFAIVKFVMLVLVLAFLASGFFIVQPQEQAIILRLGKPVGAGKKALLGPGLHWSFPYPIDEVVRVSVAGVQKVRSSVGWYYTTPQDELAGTEPPAGPTLNPLVDSYTMTGDRDIVHCRVDLTYGISDPLRYVFDFVDASNAVLNVVDNALVEESSRFTIDAILYHSAVFRDAIAQRITQLAVQQKLGISVEQCSIEPIPPRQVKDAFESVVKALVTYRTKLEDAHNYANQTTNRASADAFARISLAEADGARLDRDWASRAAQFNDNLPKYRLDPRLFVEQRLTETMGHALTNVENKIMIPENAGGMPKEIRLLLSRPLPKPKVHVNDQQNDNE
jgi:modulator of FtsH protease HflK